MAIWYPANGEYDEGLGIEPDILSYIKESHTVELRMNYIRCYLLQSLQEGTAAGSSTSPYTLGNYTSTNSQYRSVIWPSGSVGHPDIRPDSNNGSGSIVLKIDNQVATRILDPNDLINDNEYAIVKRNDLSSKRVEVVFNAGFNPVLHTITYYYTTMDQGMSVERLKSYEATLGSPFGWQQYLNYDVDKYVDYHQIMVRLPLTVKNITIDEEGLVLLKDNNCWTLWEPYINNFDILVVPASESPTEQELRFQIKEKQDSIVQGVFISQRFKIKALPLDDIAYSIPYVTS